MQDLGKRGSGEGGLTGLRTQLLPVRGLLLFRLGAGVRAPVEGGHGTPFTVGVQATVAGGVGRLELGVTLCLLQCTHYKNTHRHTHIHTTKDTWEDIPALSMKASTTERAHNGSVEVMLAYHFRHIKFE